MNCRDVPYDFLIGDREVECAEQGEEHGLYGIVINLVSLFREDVNALSSVSENSRPLLKCQVHAMSLPCFSNLTSKLLLHVFVLSKILDDLH